MSSEYVRHAYINGLHHVMVVWYNDGVWEVGIAALTSRRIAFKCAWGHDDLDKIASITNTRAGVRPAWFINQLTSIMRTVHARYGMQAYEAHGADVQRYHVYKWVLSKRGWRADDYNNSMYIVA